MRGTEVMILAAALLSLALMAMAGVLAVTLALAAMAGVLVGMPALAMAIAVMGVVECELSSAVLSLVHDVCTATGSSFTHRID